MTVYSQSGNEVAYKRALINCDNSNAFYLRQVKMCNNSDSLKSGIISKMQEERTLYLKASSLKDTQYEILKIENKEASTLNLKLIEDKSKFFKRGFRNVLITAVLSSVATIFILK